MRDQWETNEGTDNNGGPMRGHNNGRPMRGRTIMEDQ